MKIINRASAAVRALTAVLVIAFLMGSPAFAATSEEKLSTNINEIFDLCLSDEELKQLSAEVSRVAAETEGKFFDLGNLRPDMPLSTWADLRTGNYIMYMDGYKFGVAEGTDMSRLMNEFQTWDFEGNLYKDLFFSKNWTYKTSRVRDGAQSIFVNPSDKVITFNVNESINELPVWEILAVQRLTVVKDMSNAAEAKQ